MAETKLLDRVPAEIVQVIANQELKPVQKETVALADNSTKLGIKPSRLKSNQNLIPGQNPSGRPKGIMGLVRNETGDGKELVMSALSILRGEMVIERTIINEKGKMRTFEDSPSFRDKIAVIEWLADRGFGKAVEIHLDLNPDDDFKAKAKELARELLQQQEERKAIDV